MKNKSFVTMLEMIMVVIALYIAFNVFFPGFSYKNKWSEALLLQTARDAILTADRIGRLYEYSFNRAALQNFLNDVVSKESIISWSERDGAIKNQIVIACNCTNQQMVNLNSWMFELKINGRQISTVQCYTNLEFINPCMDSSDVLVIWGEKDLSNPIYYNTLKKYLNGNGGIVEIVDFSNTLDSVQANIFGLKDGGAWGSPNYDILLKPLTANNVTYQAYKIYLNGLGGNSSITEFCYHPTTKKIIPSDGDSSKILVRVDNDPSASCVIFNSTRIAWIADFSSGFNGNHTKLLASLLFATSNKKEASSSIPIIRTGYLTSYINIKNADMFEVYRFDLGLGYPY
jgi:hypothetical protein